MKVGTIYIHYGSNVFDPALFKPIRNSEFICSPASNVTDAGRMKNGEHNVEHNDEHRRIPSRMKDQTPPSKPSGGLWASRIDDAYGWAAWCRENGFNLAALRHSFTFTLKSGSRVVELCSLADINSLPLQRPWRPKDMSWMETLRPGQIPTPEQLEALYTPNPVYIDFEKLVEMGVDAVEIVDYGAVAEAFPLWDCNSMIVLRAGAVEVVG